MVRSYRVGASIGGALLAGLLLTGCSAGGDDAASPSSAASPSASESEAGRASPEAPSEPGAEATAAEYVPASLEGPARNVPKPVMPELAKEESREGAQAFLDYWSDAMWYAYQTGDTSYAREITSEHCEACFRELDDLESVYSDGKWTIGGQEAIEVEDSEIFRAADGIYKPTVVYKRYSGQLVSSDGVEVHAPAEPGDKSLLYMDYKDGRWVYITLAPIAGEKP